MALVNTKLVLDVDAQRAITGGTMVFRCQAPADQAALRKLCDRDRVVPAVMRWVDDNQFVIEPAPAPAPKAAGSQPDPEADAAAALAKEKGRLMRAGEKELKTIAGERGVAWDPAAGKETMVERLIAAAAPKKPE
jgi:hypothetical protein